MKIKWDNFLTVHEVLNLATSEYIEAVLTRKLFRWLGHVARMPDDRVEVGVEKRRIGRPLLRYKDTLKDLLEKGYVLHTWSEAVRDR